MGRRRLTMTEKFFARVEITDTCWLWRGAIANGYGKIPATDCGTMAHRAAYELFIGDIPNTLQVDHICRVRNCVNPEHLELVTNKENMRRAIPYRPKSYPRKNVCRRGHQQTPENVRWHTSKDGRKGRNCRLCQNITARLRYREKVNDNNVKGR